MKKVKSYEIRQKHLDFFEVEKGHMVEPSTISAN